MNLPETAHRARRDASSYTLLTEFKNTELPESAVSPALSRTQYGELRWQGHARFSANGQSHRLQWNAVLSIPKRSLRVILACSPMNTCASSYKIYSSRNTGARSSAKKPAPPKSVVNRCGTTAYVRCALQAVDAASFGICHGLSEPVASPHPWPFPTMIVLLMDGFSLVDALLT